MSPRGLRLLACLGLVVARCVWIAPAGADVFGSIGLVSAGTLAGTTIDQQANFASNPAISGDGRYVAFQGSIGGRTGIFRRDLQTGEIAVVVEGNAVLPSISEDGRYISFTTTARLDEENAANSAPNVYVRDMDVPSDAPCGKEWEGRGEPCAFTLASAVDESSRGLEYEYDDPPAEEKLYGSLAAGRTALSANGRKVAFITTAISNLAGAKTPKLQVAVRNLETKSTELVSVVYEDGKTTSEPVPTSEEGYGAVFPGASLTPSFPQGPYAGASISADGSTVAWMGTQVGKQAPTLPIGDPASEPKYTEPLWRRIGEGTSSPTRRITGGSDPVSPACQQSGETELQLPPTLSDPCQGPFETQGGQGEAGAGLWTAGAEQDYLPRLSANGQMVAFLATAREIASGEELKSSEHSDDLYVANMADGLTRVQALRRLTELASGSAGEEARNAPIVDLGISPDGSEIAFTTERTVFPLGSPAYVSAPAAAVGAMELFDVDLADETLTRVTQSFEGKAPEAPAGQNPVTASPSFSANGQLLAFASNSDDLVYGEGNKASNAFVVERLSFPSVPASQEVSSVPADPALIPTWDLSVTAFSRGNGSISLYVYVPGAGTLTADAEGAVPVTEAAAACRRHPRGCHVITSVARRVLASGGTRPSASGLIVLQLQLGNEYDALAERGGGLDAAVNVVFSAAGHTPLHQTIEVSFHRTPSRKPAHRARTSAKRKRGHRP